MNRSELVFVYGRLRTGFWNQFLLGRRNPLGTARTVHKYALYASRMPYVRTDRPICPVWGEVYAVNARTLRDLDSLMSHPSWYQRREVPVEFGDRRTMTAWMYTRRGDGGVLVKTGDLLDCTVAVAEPD